VTNDVAVQGAQVQYLDPVVNLTPADLTELGGMLAAAGLTTIQARGLIAKVQQAAAQTALALAPALLDEVRKVQEARLYEVISRTRLLPNVMGTGYISRDRVIQIIQDVFSKTPRM
jgi:hypothetical protein